MTDAESAISSAGELWAAFICAVPYLFGTRLLSGETQQSLQGQKNPNLGSPLPSPNKVNPQFSARYRLLPRKHFRIPEHTRPSSRTRRPVGAKSSHRTPADCSCRTTALADARLMGPDGLTKAEGPLTSEGPTLAVPPNLRWDLGR